MKLRYIIATIVVICVAILGVLVTMGPSLSLQTPPIEVKAQDYLNKKGFLKSDETLKAYKATSYYTYDSGIVVTDKRIFAFHKDAVHSLPLDKITMVVIKSTALGHQEVMISAESDGVIDFEIYHADVDKLVDMLGVSDTIVKRYAKQDVKEAKEIDKENQKKFEEMQKELNDAATSKPVDSTTATEPVPATTEPANGMVVQ